MQLLTRGRALSAASLLQAGCLFGGGPDAAAPNAWADAVVAPDPSDVSSSPPSTRQLVLVTLDGARWQELFYGVNPALAVEAGLGPEQIVDAEHLTPRMHARFFRRGVVVGAPELAGGIYASGPDFISLPGYLEILRGHPSFDCTSNDCPATFESTLLDEVRAQPGATARDVAAFTSWETCARAASADPSQMVLSAGRTHGSVSDLSFVDPVEAELSAAARASSPWPGHGDYRPDAHTGPLAVRYLARARPRAMWLGLGDTDEWAHKGDYGQYLKSLRQADAILGALFAVLDQSGEYGRTTTVIVTADHGRGPAWTVHGRDASASRVFLLAAGGSVPRRGPVATPRARHLSDVAPTARALLGLSTDPSDGTGAAIAELLPAAEPRRAIAETPRP